jgi:iron complex transport system permease protein
MQTRPAATIETAGIEYSKAGFLQNHGRWLALIGVLMVIVILAATIGAPVPFSDLWSSEPQKMQIARRIFWREGGLSGGDWGLRPVRIFAGMLVGAALASSGACLQSVFRNPLAEPYLLGVSSGGALGATVGLWLQPRAAFDLSVPLAFVGALTASALVYALGTTTSGATSSTGFASGNRLNVNRTGGGNRGVLLLSGVALSSFLSSLMALILALSDSANLAQKIVFWSLGTLTRASSSQNVLLLIVLCIGMTILLRSSRDLNALRMGDEEAQTLGVDVRKLHFRLLFAAALMSAVAVAFCGLIGFVGLLAPQAVRKMFGGDIRVLVPAAAIGGATLLVGCDAIARSVAPPVELPVGVVTALLGVPLFLWLARRS